MRAFVIAITLSTARGLAPHPRSRRTALRSTTEDTETSQRWLADRGLVAPGASPELHARARAARRTKAGKKGAALALRPKKARWGDAARVRDVPVEGGWSNARSRGATTDASKVVAGEKARRVSQILVATRGVASELRTALAAARADFGDLASSMSLCDVSKAEAGSIGWVDARAAVDDATEPLLPLEARLELMATPLKPGDVAVVASRRGFHVVKVDDVMRDLDLVATKRRRGVDRGGDLRAACAGKTYAVVTMGCQMNAADSERLEGSLVGLGLAEARDPAEADVVVLNTCSIREHAETKVYSHVGPQAKRKREGEDVTIVVAGCVAQQEGARLLRRAPEVDVVMGPQYANRLEDVLEGAMLRGEQVEATSASYGALDHVPAATTKRSSEVSAWVTVAHGCNERCTYCVVPNTRGVEQSRAPEDILAEVRDLGARGYREVTLLGQNVDAYGRDMRPRRRFSDLLEAVADVARDEAMRVRFVTSHPRYITDAVVDAVATHADVLMPVFHMPAQSGDDGVLRLMGRGYTAERYLRVVAKIKEALPDATVSGDFIVGCPGETDAAFERTLALMDAVEFDACMTAAYSPRPGTPMAHWDGAADAFAALGVTATASTDVADARAAVHDAFRGKARARLAAARAGAGGGDEAWDALVKAKAAALRALDRAAAAPPSAFHPLSGVGPRQCDDDVKEERLRRINEKANAHAKARSERYVGRVEAVLVESRNTRVPTQVVGRTRGNKLVFFEGGDELIGGVVDVRIVEANTFSLVGERVAGGRVR